MFLGEYIGNPTKFVEGKNVQGLVTSNHNVGVEVEIENIRYDFQSDNPSSPNNSYFIGCNSSELPKIHKHWSIVRDNSLRNGVEFIFNGPKKGAGIVEALGDMDLFFSKFRRNGNPVRSSDRCSIHVHVDVRDLDESQLNRLIMIYMLVERILFAYVSPSRLKNNYCRPVTDSSFKHILDSINTKSDPFVFSDAVSIIRTNCDKYSALNLLPIQNFGTVEFRHHQGTSDMNEVLDWINILLSIKLASNYNPSDILNTYRYKGYLELMSLIFEGTVLMEESFLTRSDLPDLIKKGMNDYLEILNFNELKERTNSKPSAYLSFDLLKLFANENKIEIDSKPKSRATKYKRSDYTLEEVVLPPPSPHNFFSNPQPSSAFQQFLDEHEGAEVAVNGLLNPSSDEQDEVVNLEEESE